MKCRFNTAFIGVVAQQMARKVPKKDRAALAVRRRLRFVTAKVPRLVPIRPIVISRFFSDARVVAYLAKEPQRGRASREAELHLLLSSTNVTRR